MNKEVVNTENNKKDFILVIDPEEKDTNTSKQTKRRHSTANSNPIVPQIIDVDSLETTSGSTSISKTPMKKQKTESVSDKDRASTLKKGWVHDRGMLS